MLKTALLAAFASIALSATSHATLIAYWNFNTGASGVPWTSPIAATQGTGSILLTGWTGTTDGFAGTTINALDSDVSGASLSLVGQLGNNSFIDITFSMTGLADPVVSFAARGTTTGFDTGSWSYSTDGVNFTTFVSAPNTATRTTSFALMPTVDFSSIDALDGAATVTLRYTLSGASSDAGNNRIDNLQINTVPEPGTVAMVGLGLTAVLFGARLRRRS